MSSPVMRAYRRTFAVMRKVCLGTTPLQLRCFRWDAWRNASQALHMMTNFGAVFSPTTSRCSARRWSRNDSNGPLFVGITGLSTRYAAG